MWIRLFHIIFKNNLEVNPRKVKNTKKIFIVSDSMIKNITDNGISRTNTIQIRPHPGATTVDIYDYIKPELHHKLDAIIIRCGTNDIENEINTVKKIRKLVKEIDVYDKQNSPKVVMSSLIKRCDQDLMMILLLSMKNFSVSVTVRVCL